jgi:hypothetical protein
MLTLSLIPSLSVQAKVNWIYSWISDSVAEDKEDGFVLIFFSTQQRACLDTQLGAPTLHSKHCVTL